MHLCLLDLAVNMGIFPDAAAEIKAEEHWRGPCAKAVRTSDLINQRSYLHAVDIDMCEPQGSNSHRGIHCEAINSYNVCVPFK